VVFFRKLFIIDYQLPYPSGAATGAHNTLYICKDTEDITAGRDKETEWSI
jgi:uncharacterized oligopeptide transporter (OPT) family protein